MGSLSDGQKRQIAARAFARTSDTISAAVGAQQRMGSTATVVVVHRCVDGGARESDGGWAVHCAWVGDSRAAVIPPSGAGECLNEDHRLELYVVQEGRSFEFELL